MQLRRVYIDGVHVDCVAGEPPFHLGQRVAVKRGSFIDMLVCTELGDEVIRLSSEFGGMDFPSRVEAAFWS